MIDLEELRIDPACVARVSPAFAMRRLVLPLSIVGGEFQVAVASDCDPNVVQLLERELGMPVHAVKADAGQLRLALLKYYGEARGASVAATGGAASDPVAEVESLLRTAALRGSSDIHLDPGRDGVRVRFRTDGELEDVKTLPPELQGAVVGRLKVMAGLDIAERRSPQDGAFGWRCPPSVASAHVPALDVRMATLPVRHGERVTLRLLEADSERLALNALGFSPEQEASFNQVLERPHGLVLLTGPTGSGKTTTLYASIRRLLERRPLNILTVEDPIEYEIQGVAQAEVDASDKVNFSKALRSLLRHDPDVVMIGEIRDAESLDTAVKAALTGHLVLSTLHANDAVGAVTRMSDMGLERHLAAAVLRLAVAQRLVRALCRRCCVEDVPTVAETATMGLGEGARVYRPSGCLYCAGRGRRGRTGLFEFFVPDAEIASLIAAGAPAGELLSAAREKGMHSLLDDARAKCLAGVIAPEEAMGVIGGGC